MLIDLDTEYPKRLDALLKHYQIPAIWMNSKHDSDCVYHDDEQASYEATRILQSMGHRRVLCLGVHSLHYSGDDRVRGYGRAMLEGLLAGEVVHPVGRHFRYDTLAAVFENQMKRADRPTAIVGSGGIEQMAVVRLAGQAGLKIPEDLSVISFESDYGLFETARLSVMLLDEHRLGLLACASLLKKIDNPTEPLDPVVLTPKLNAHYSIGPAPTSLA